jgi:hypothetical protein
MSELTERYVGATLRSLPDTRRADIEAELRASIADAIEARVAGGAPVDDAETEALTELGDPDRLAASYAGRPGYLIGPELFYAWRRLLAVLLLSAVPVTMAVVAVAQAISGDTVASIVGSSVSTGITLSVHLVFWTTLVFALIERSGRRPATPEWSPSDLPPLPSKGTVKLWETITTIGFLAAAIVGLSLFARTDFSPVTVDGVGIALIDPSLWSLWVPFFIVVLAAEIVFEWVKYRVGVWTWALASVNLALNALFAVPAIYLLVSGRFLNPEFFAELGFPEAARAGSASMIVSAIVVALVSLYDVIDGFRKARMS